MSAGARLAVGQFNGFFRVRSTRESRKAKAARPPCSSPNNYEEKSPEAMSFVMLCYGRRTIRLAWDSQFPDEAGREQQLLQLAFLNLRCNTQTMLTCNSIFKLWNQTNTCKDARWPEATRPAF